ncbi:MAG TPA: MOSC domain-containing protein [Rugosimonospora sp.]|nr:MOSC domain-containing protein [Rugosimonospora sp.]
MSHVLTVNLGVPEPNSAKSIGVTGIDKQPVDRAVEVRAPGPKHGGAGSGLVGDAILDVAHHGGDDQAVYAYAREDYAWWEAELGRPLRNGLFGENLTTGGVDVCGALVGERWRIGDELELQTTFGRIPCVTFQAKMGEPQWIKRFTRANRTGTYLRVVRPGLVRPGDPVTVVHRPSHGVTIAEAFRAWMLEPELLPRLLEVEELADEIKVGARQRLAGRP